MRATRSLPPYHPHHHATPRHPPLHDRIYDPLSKPDDPPSKFRFDYCFDSFKPGAPNFVPQEKVFRAVGLDILAKAW